MSEDRIWAENPNPDRKPTHIKLAMYTPVRQAILEAIAEAGELRFSELREAVVARTPSALWENASSGWSVTTVKLDLEAKGLIQKSGSPQRLRLVSA